MDELSTFLVVAREKAGVTQKDIAKAMGYSTPQFVSNWERNVAPFPVAKAKEFVKITKCSQKGLYDAVVARYSNRISKHFAAPKARK